MEQVQSTAYSPELRGMVRTIAALAEIYWHPDCFPKNFEEARSDWFVALVQFTAGYAYERQGAAPAYRALAKEVLQSAGGELERPDANFAPRALVDTLMVLSTPVRSWTETPVWSRHSWP